MNSAITRQVSVDLITDTPNEIIEWFNNLWSKLCIIETNVHHNMGGEIIYYTNNEEKHWIFYEDDKDDKFWCNIERYWLIMETKFNINYIDIQLLTKLLVENALNNTIAIPHSRYLTKYSNVENVLDNIKKVVIPTPNKTWRLKHYKVDNVLSNIKNV